MRERLWPCATTSSDGFLLFSFLFFTNTNVVAARQHHFLIITAFQILRKPPVTLGWLSNARRPCIKTYVAENPVRRDER